MSVTCNIVQLPFPSTATPHPGITAYYADYSHVFAHEMSSYFIPAGSLWELPLWVAHLSGMIEHLGLTAQFIDLSQFPADADACARRIIASTEPGQAVLLSPLAQNYAIALQVSRRLIAAGRRTILGGNMAGLSEPADATVIHRGLATPHSLLACLRSTAPVVTHMIRQGDQADWFPDYTLLESYRGKVPLLRLNASHGCLYTCDFCGDAWSRSLTLVSPAVLEHEIGQFERLFPETRLIYIGDKTFGQSKAAVRNLRDVFAERKNYRFIVQTHVAAIDEQLLDNMQALGVLVVELGFETASADVLRANRKSNRSLEFLQRTMRRLTDRGFRIVLNVLSGLPEETRESHTETLAFIHDARREIWLFNLYNFVPYPLTAQFNRLRDRIVDWEFSNWVEDGPPVFIPWHVTREESYGFFLEKVAAAHETISRRVSAGGADEGPVAPSFTEAAIP
ncbi:radical SAM protein (plasmid) [Mesorhizobium sp. AR02]|uniref:B12-binding domain-containing radical SAM protein n=1 Tax=Mesorhizobium sp. AR02 TaxID=2865837 RepID=UPI00215EDBE4|nr:radical SAM protein [Mesorhizobium sp. AR02]UVK49626.1 radical SAM protein [Mesorhizobium sp. AR02]